MLPGGPLCCSATSGCDDVPRGVARSMDDDNIGLLLPQACRSDERQSTFSHYDGRLRSKYYDEIQVAVRNAAKDPTRQGLTSMMPRQTSPDTFSDDDDAKYDTQWSKHTMSPPHSVPPVRPPWSKQVTSVPRNAPPAAIGFGPPVPRSFGFSRKLGSVEIVTVSRSVSSASVPKGQLTEHARIAAQKENRAARLQAGREWQERLQGMKDGTWPWCSNVQASEPSVISTAPRAPQQAGRSPVPEREEYDYDRLVDQDFEDNPMQRHSLESLERRSNVISI